MTSAAIAPAGPPGLRARTSRRLWRRWITANAVGELVGLGLTGAVAAAAVALLDPRWPVAAAAAIVASGAIEGTIVGYAQWRVLHDHIPMAARRWIIATVVGALAAWGAGVVPSLAFSDGGGAGAEPSLVVQLALAALLGLVAGPILGGPQAVALRDRVDRPWRWVAANAAAWACALPVTFLAPSLVSPRAPLAMVGAFAVGAFAAGAVAGAVHGVVLVSLAGGRGADLLNPVLHRVLRSHWGRLLPGLALLEFAGRRSGCTVDVVAGHVDAGGSEIVVAADAPSKRWWRNFQDPRPLTLWVRGTSRPGTGRIVTDEPELTQAVTAYQRRHGPTLTASDIRDGRAAVVVIDRIEQE
jgi:hypothetical protein